MTLTLQKAANRLREKGIQPSAQRAAIAAYVWSTSEHPTADKVFEEVLRALPVISKATVYNTLHLLVERELLRELKFETAASVYDPNVGAHHHFIDDRTGEIHDIPWEAVDVRRIDAIDGFQVHEYQVVMHGEKK